jgi:hypothetical protein
VPYAVIQSGSTLSLELVDSYGTERVALLDGYDAKSELVSLQIYHDQGSNSSEAADRVFHLIAVSKQNLASIWALNFTGKIINKSNRSTLTWEFFSESLFVTSRLISQKPFKGLVSAIAQVEAVDFMSSWMAPSAQLGPYLFSTFSTDNFVRFWRPSKSTIDEAAKDDLTESFVEVGHHKVGDDVSICKVSPLGKIITG